MHINLEQGLSGLDIIQKIPSHSIYEKIPIVSLTPNTMVGDKEQFIKPDFTYYSSKPFQINQIARIDL